MSLFLANPRGRSRWRWDGLRRFKYTAVPSDPSEAPGEDFIYSELDALSKQIRLLDLLPSGEFNAEIVCNLRTVSLDTRDFHYDALSYSWGNPEIVDHIIVNGVSRQVTLSLALALRHLRSAHNILTLWVDAVCIDQANIVEREQQIRLMRRIYRYAAATRAWLGPSSVSNDLAFDFFSYLAKTPDAWEFDLPEYLSNAPSHFLDFKEIFQRAWWSRVWVLQEIALASKRIIHCGHRFIKLPELFEAYRSLRSFGKSGLLTTHTGMIDAAHLSDLVATMGQSLGLMNEISSKDAEEDERGFEFLKLLASCRESHATDALDKIYGLLGMAPKWVREAIQPDYGQSIEALYTEICVRLAWRANSPLVLSQATTAQRDTNRKDWLPTWIPDWRYQGQRWTDMELRLQQEKLFNACGQFQRLALAPIHTKGVAMRGFCSDMIINVSDKMPQHCEHMNAAACFASWEAFSLSGVSPKLFEESIGGAFTSAYWRTLLNGAVPGDDDSSNLLRLEDSDLKTFSIWRTQNKAVRGRQEPFLLLNQPDKWTDYVSLTTRNRRLFMCANGTLGIGPADTQVGDLVFIVAGGTQPVILRAAKKKLDLYCLVGECFIDGIMDGQATLRPPAHLPNLLKGQRTLRKRRFPALNGLLKVFQQLSSAISQYAEDSELVNFFSPYSRYHWDNKKRKFVRTIGKVLEWDAQSFSDEFWRFRSPARMPLEDESDDEEERFFEYEINDAGEKVPLIEMGDFVQRVAELRGREALYGNNEKGWRTIVLY